MAVKIRLARRGRKKLAMYDIVVADARAPRDGKFIEKIGTYNPNTNPASIVLNEANALKWIMNGAQPTDTTRAILSYKGILLKKHLQVGVNKGAITQESADEKFGAWKEVKEAKIIGKSDGLDVKAAADKATRMAREVEINAARAAAIVKKNTVEVPVEEVEEEVEAEAPVVEEVVAEVPAVEEVVAEAPAVVEEVASEAPAVVEEAPVAEPVAEAPATEEAKAESAE
ncbi:MAG: 30S ribosomal protein S16 [Arcicella sp.]|nr:30S ribosomal protein S16 [Arcicella sp.]